MTMTRKKKIFIVATAMFAILFIVLTILALIFRQTEPINPSIDNAEDIDQNSYVDPASGETILDPSPEDKAPEAETLGSNVTLLGFSKLLELGLSKRQQDLAIYYSESYAADEKIGDQTINQISLVADSFKQSVDKSTGAKNLVADIKINGTFEQKIEIHYIGTADMFFEVIDLSGRVIWSSPYDDESGHVH